MFHPITRFYVVIICIAAVVGCLHRPARVVPPRINPSAAGAAAVKQYDTNGDGAVDGEEMEKAPSLNRAIHQIDHDGDGKIRAEEIADRIKQWQESKLGRKGLSCTVKKGGKPLEGATVKFVPEKFLGDQVQTATGVTDANGIASMSVPISSDQPPGVAPGLYLVQITKQGEDIPAKYNTETILGEEIANDAEALISGGPTYNVD